MRFTLTHSWVRSETIQTRVDLLSDPPEQGIVHPAPPHGSSGIVQLPRPLTATATTPTTTDDGR